MRGTILLVDDEERNLKLLEVALRPKNHRILKARSGEECLDLLGREEVHLVLLDVMMPGLSGYDVLERIRAGERTRALPVIMVTALREREERIRGIELGADDFLSKPVDLGELKARVETQMRLAFLRAELAEKEQVLRIIGQIDEGVIITRRDLVPLVLNERARALLELGDSPGDVSVHLRERFGIELDLARAAGEHLLERRETEKHRPLFLSLNLQAVRNFRNEVDSYVFLVRDVTEAHVDELLRQDFLGLLSHKLRTPLTIIKAAVPLLRSQCPEETAKTLVGTISEQSDALIGLINRLFHFIESEQKVFSRPDETPASAIDDIVARCGARYPEKRYVLEKSLTIKSFEKHWRVILEELIDNAFKFHDKALLNLGVAVDEASLSVADNGPGIPPEEREKVFQAFYQPEKEFTGNVPGAGLGLALVKKIVELLGGEIKLSGALGAGTTCTIHFS